MIHVTVTAARLDALGAKLSPPDDQVTPTASLSVRHWMKCALDDVDKLVLPDDWVMWKIHRDSSSLHFKFEDEFRRACLEPVVESDAKQVSGGEAVDGVTSGFSENSLIWSGRDWSLRLGQHGGL